MEDYKKQIEHWKTLDRYYYDWIFREVVNDFEKSLVYHYTERMHKHYCELQSVVQRLTDQLDNEHVSEEFCKPIIEEAKKLIAF